MSNMYARQSTACPQDKLKDLNVLVVGVGAIGRQIARQVGLLGVKSITCVDDDIIEEHNVVPQMFPVSAIGKLKVLYIQEELEQLCPTVQVNAIPVKWNPKIGNKFDVVFPTVDNIEIRANVFSFYQEKCKAFFDIRIGGDMALVLSAVGSFNDKDWYKKTLFKKSEANRSGCAQPMTNFIANVSSGLAVAQFANWVTGRGPVNKISEYCALDNSITPLSEDIFND